MDQNIDSSGFDQIQSPQYPVNHHISQADVEEVLQDKEKFMQDTQTFLEKFNRFSFGFTPKVLTIAWERIDKIKYVLTEPEEIPELMYKLREDGIFKKIPDAVTTVLPTEEPEYSLSMGYEHLSTTPETELDEVTDSSAKNLLPIPSECEVTSKDESECDMPAKDESFSVFTTFSNPLFDDNDDLTSSDDESLSEEEVPIKEFKVYSNRLFDDEEINSDKIDSLQFNSKSEFVESLSNCDTLDESSSKFDYLEEFSGAFMPTCVADVKRIKKDNAEMVILKGKRSIFLPVRMNCYLQDNLLFPRPRSKPPDVEFDLEPEVILAVINNKDELNEDECFDPGGEIDVLANVEDDDYFPFTFVIRIFLP
uniref:Reverse transcriptase domain-containing protein n=1 Tax=Tanacetum cinerariifolium TaxID=118510 RepID=A0A699IPL4_TANCI|nr:hypothetical protein [Tanacetum cinerariifolium]